MRSFVLENLLWPDLLNSITLHLSTLNIILQAVGQPDKRSSYKPITDIKISYAKIERNSLIQLKLKLKTTQF